MTLIANNRFFRRKWDLDLFNSTILSDVWPDILFFTAFSTAVTLVHQLTPHKLGIDTQLLVVAGVVLGLVISFRTSSAYERYRDGAKMWSNIRTGSRILAQLIWIHVPDEREADEDGHAPSPTEVIMEKRTMINLIHAFAVSVKHLLRGEPGVFYEDLYPSVAHLPRYAADKPHPNDILPLWHIHGGRKMTPAAAKRKDTLMAQVSTDIPELKPARMPPDTTIYDYFGILRLGRFIGRRLARKTGLKSDPPPKRPKKRIAYSEVVESTVPLELHLILSNYTAFLMQKGLLNPSIANAMTNALAQLHDALAHLDRICNNPIPFAYQAHLRICLWLWLLILPFQLINALGYVTIPATAFVAFLLTGFLEIGQEIENPFNYGLNDLNLDWYCDTIRRNLHEITAIPKQDPQDYIFNDRNQPFAPLDRRTAAELISTPDGEYKSTHLPSTGAPTFDGLDGVRQLLLRNWKEVDCLTRKVPSI